MIEKKLSVKDQRQKAAKLISDVLSKEIDFPVAVKKYPRNDKDDSLECAFHALLHYDADDDFRKKDPEYAEEQKKYLREIVDLFSKGQPLPANIINDYKQYYEYAPLLSKTGIINIIKSLFRIII